MSKNLEKNLSWTTIGMVVYNFAIWVFGALVLRLLGGVASGYYAVAISIGNTLYAISLWGMRAFVVADQNQTYSYDEYFSVRIYAILLSCVLLFVSTIVFGYSSAQNTIIFLYAIFKFSEAIIELLDCFGQQQLQMDVNAKSMVLRGILFSALFYFTLQVTKNLPIGFVVLLLISILMLLFYNLPRIKKIVSITPKLVWNQNVIRIIKDCAPIMVFELLAAAIIAIPRLFFERVGSLEALGIYTSIYSMVVFLQLVINVLIYTFAPYMAKAYEANDNKSFKNYIVLLFGGAIGLGLLAEGLVYFLGKPVMSLLFGQMAGEYYHYLYLGILSGVTLTFTWILSQIFVIIHRTSDQLICSIVSTIACFVLSYYFINPADCNSMTMILIGTNLLFVVCAILLLLFRKNPKEDRN
ncbi:MAG: lipopolysaccharide biosynthesis protein [Solobacterium sp.]|nr:lipopolysaccharide biosynthesis protein [Solobacterium sp.]